ncbi:hypothetical protein H6F88_04965 [Oculatella sp. FACHB-28]|uniref:CU044_2847 family protein n=1 Tax=Oculatella sp. FACHB-28 TaxID=2692845 RepID=UPI0016890CCD|nr:CU044_2847 family protein [Oculatella sp. FACHB-28]MBD2055379.1 hypothetical protein [Oculatella sp. FACHB-28]
MSRLQAIQVDENTVIYVEATEEVETPITVPQETEGEVRRGGAKGAFSKPPEQMARSFQAIEGTIRTYTSHTLKAFKELAIAEVKKVTLEFGVNVTGVGGVPYIASGTAGCNIKITVECAFPEPKSELPPAP